MERDAYQSLVQWKVNPKRKPLVLMGARQVGKTWLLNEFGRREYSDVVRLDFTEDDELAWRIFPDRSASGVVDRLETWLERKINPESTLIILDEVQEVPNALACLKSFAETAPQYHVVAAGSLLGVALHGQSSFPVGKVDFLDLHPLTFGEFLRATGRERLNQVRASDAAAPFAADLERLLKTYYLVGGMPEVVASFISGEGWDAVRSLQDAILRAYELDISKHAPTDMVPKIRDVFASMPNQLAKENKRFLYGQVAAGARARSHELAIRWLADAGLVHMVSRVSVPRVPLSAYCEEGIFKLFLVDIGLLARMSGLVPTTVLERNLIFTEFKGALTEQLVLQEFAACGITPYYWANGRNQAEIDFVVDIDNSVIPVEVKAETNLKAKSLRAYRDRFEPPVAVRASLAGRRLDDGLINLPLWQFDQLMAAVRTAMGDAAIEWHMSTQEDDSRNQYPSQGTATTTP